MSQRHLHEVAIGYLLAHQSEHLHHDRQYLIRRCTDHLQQQGISHARATILALQALGEMEARGHCAHIDLGNSTGFAVFVVDPVSRTTFAFTATDLIRLARNHALDVARPTTTH